MKTKIVIIGGIGNGSVIADAITDAAFRFHTSAEVYGFLNDRMAKGSSIGNYSVLGGLKEVSRLLEEGCRFIYTIYRIDGQEERLQLFHDLAIPAENLFTFIHPAAYVAPSAQIGTGCIIMPLASVSAEAVIGKCCLLMVNASVGHNTQIGEHCHLAAQSCLSSFVTIKEGVHIGLNATVRENLVLQRCSALGMGSVLLENVGEKEIWAGNPARYLRNAL